MGRVEQVIGKIKEIRSKLEWLEQKTNDGNSTTGHILRAFANFYEDELDDLISDIEWVEVQLEDFVDEREENE